MHPPVFNLAGKKFGRLTPIVYVGHSRWKARCDCGKETIVLTAKLINGHTGSCGCLGRDRVRESLTKHGEAGNGKRSKEYSTWAGAKARCNIPSCVGYKYYGGRGIKVCERWLNDYGAFLADMGRCPPGCSLDRIDPNGNYCPENCRWASDSVQAINKSNVRRHTANGETLTVREWAEKLRCRRGYIWFCLWSGDTMQSIVDRKAPANGR